MDLNAVRNGLRTAADAVEGLTVYEFGPDAVVVPAFLVAECEQDFDSALSVGMDVAVFNCRALVSKTDDRSGQALIDAYMGRSGPTSVKAALERDRTLAGLVIEVFVTKNIGPRVFTHQGIDYLGCEWKVRVTGRGE